MKIMFWKRTQKLVLSEKEREILERENEESRNHAIPDSPASNVFGDGSFINSISRIQSTTSQNGLGEIAKRRVIEPRSGQNQNDQDSL